MAGPSIVHRWPPLRELRQVRQLNPALTFGRKRKYTVIFASTIRSISIEFCDLPNQELITRRDNFHEGTIVKITEI